LLGHFPASDRSTSIKRESALEPPVDALSAALSQLAIDRRKRLTAKKSPVRGKWGRVGRCENNVLSLFDKLRFGFGGFAPENKNDRTGVLVQFLNYLIGKTFPTSFAVRVCLALLNGQHRV